MKKTVMKKTVMIVMVIAILASISVVKAEGDSVVSYDYDNTVTTNNPDYLVSIPAGIVFKNDEVSGDVGIDVELVLPDNLGEVPVGCQVDIGVSSKKGYFVSLDKEGKDDPVEYQLNYGEIALFGKHNVQKVGTLGRLNEADQTITILKGTGFVIGYARKMGNHTDTLTYTVTDQSTYI